MKRFWAVLGRALRQRCPACGKSPVFQKGWELHEKCPACGLVLRDREPDTYFFMYMLTAAITGVFLLLMLFWLPPNVPAAQAAVIGAATAVFFYTMSLRKSVAIALDYLFDG